MLNLRQAVSFVCAISTTACCWSSPALARPVDLTEAMPEDTLLYIGRAGSDQTGKLAKTGAYGKLMADPAVRRFFAQLDHAIDQFAGDQLEDVKTYRAIKDILQTLAERPAAIAILDGGATGQGPFVEAALVSHVGKDAKRFLKNFDDLMTLTEAPPREETVVGGLSMTQVSAPIPGGLYYGLINDHFLIALGDQAVEKIAACVRQEATSLAENKSLKLSRRKMSGDPEARSTTVFVNTARLLKKTEAIMPMMPGFKRGDDEKVTSILTNLGIDSLASICWESRLTHGGCYSGLYLHTPKGGRGLFGGSSKPLTDSDLAMIPKSPNWAMAYNLDVSAIYQGALGLFKAVDAELSQTVMGAIGQIEQTLGFRLDTDYLDLIGDTIIVYDAPENGGIWFTGTTKIVESRDPKQLRKRVRQIVKTIAKMVDGEDAVRISSFQHRNHKIEFVNVIGFPMPVAPAWAEHEQWVIIGLYPQIVTTALDRLIDGDPGKNSILANADFVKARKTMGKPGPGLAYVDTRRTFAGLYPWLLAIGQVGAAMAQGEGIEIDVTALPSQQTIAKYLFNEVRMTQCDAKGKLYASYGPMPMGLNPLMLSYANTAPMAVAVSVLLPALSRAREMSKRTVCAANLRGLGQALYISAQDRKDGAFPPDLETLLEEKTVSRAKFICPSSAASPDDGPHACYIYIPGSTTSSHPTNILIYEKPDNHTDNEGANVLFQDGHVDFVTPYSRVEELVRKTKERLSKK